jgi:hypothetical protein
LIEKDNSKDKSGLHREGGEGRIGRSWWADWLRNARMAPFPRTIETFLEMVPGELFIAR